MKEENAWFAISRKGQRPCPPPPPPPEPDDFKADLFEVKVVICGVIFVVIMLAMLVKK